MTRWQVQEAKARLSEVLEKAVNEGPQIITRYGEDYTVVMSMRTYRKREEPNTGSKSIVDFLLSGPKFKDFEVERSKELPMDEGLFDE